MSSAGKLPYGQATRLRQRNFLASLALALALHLMLASLALNSIADVKRVELLDLRTQLVISVMNENDSDEEPSAAEAEPEQTEPEAAQPPATAPQLSNVPVTPANPTPVTSKNGTRPEPAEDPLASLLGALSEGSSLASDPALQAMLAYRARTGKGRESALERFGGSARTESAVLLGLRWLASVQDVAHSDRRRVGQWSGRTFARHYLKGLDTMSGPELAETLKEEGAATVDYFNLGLTALCTMAFSGSGYTRERGEFAQHLILAINYLKGTQDGNGAFMSPDRNASGDMYDHAITLLALADAYALSQDEDLKPVIQAGLRFMLDKQQPTGGWDYKVYPPAQQPARSDMSISGFCVMALMSCKSGGFEVPDQAIRDFIRFAKWATNKDGSGIYADVSIGGMRTSDGMTAVNLFLRRLLGQSLDHPTHMKQVALLTSERPQWGDMNVYGHGPYQWYYTSLALMFQPDEAWKSFNIGMKDAILGAQDHNEGPRRGSWAPGSYVAERTGRVYSTAMCVLCLQSYYRYIPEYLRTSSEGYAGFWD